MQSIYLIMERHGGRRLERVEAEQIPYQGLDQILPLRSGEKHKLKVIEDQESKDSIANCI